MKQRNNREEPGVVLMAICFILAIIGLVWVVTRSLKASREAQKPTQTTVQSSN